MDYRIVERVFVLQSRYYVHFRANTLGKGMNTLILPVMGDLVQSQVASYQRLLNWYLNPPCLQLSNIRYVSRVKWNNPEKAESGNWLKAERGNWQWGETDWKQKGETDWKGKLTVRGNWLKAKRGNWLKGEIDRKGKLTESRKGKLTERGNWLKGETDWKQKEETDWNVNSVWKC